MQLTTLTKKSFKGFTLIELLVVIAIIGLLSTIVAAPVQTARKKAKDVKKIAEIKQMQTALANFANDNGQYPAGSTTALGIDLSSLSPQYMPNLPSSLKSGSAKDKTMFVSYRGLSPSSLASATYGTTTFGYHLGVSLEVFNTVLADDNDCWGVISTSTAGMTGQKIGGPCVNFIVQSTSSVSSAFFHPLTSSTSPVVGTSALLTGVTPVGTPLAVAGPSPWGFQHYNFLAHTMIPNQDSDFYGKGTNENASSTCATVDMCVFDLSDAY